MTNSTLMEPQPPTTKPNWPTLPKPVVDAVCRFVPALGSLRGYTFRDLGSDALAGITVATVAVPQAMAYALIAGIPPFYGLYAAIVLTLVAALFYSSRQLISGPTNAISIAVLSAVAFLPSNVDRISAAILLASMVGMIQMGITFLRLGDLTRFVSHGVIVGFTLGAAILIILGQMKHLLGISVNADPHDHFLMQLGQTFREGQINGYTAAIGLGTIGFVLGLQWLKSRRKGSWHFLLPDFLLAVIVTSLVVWAFGLHGHGVQVIGNIPAELPGFRWPDWNWMRMRQLSGSALAIALLGLLESVAMAKTIASRTKQKLDINQQCFSEGIANFVGGFFQCFPGSGSLTRSSINQQAGAKSQWAAVISAVVVALTVLYLAPLAFYIPRACLAGLLLVSAVRLIDRKQLLHHLRTTRFDAGIVLATALSAVFISVEFCILIGIFMSFVLYVPRAAKLELIELIVTPERVLREKIDSDPICNRILIYSLEGELFFGSAPDLERHLDTIRARTLDNPRVIVLNCKWARNPDAVCLGELEAFIRDMHERDIVVLFSGIRKDMAKVFDNAGLSSLMDSNHIFQESNKSLSSTLDAVRHAYDYVQDSYCQTCPKKGKNDQEGLWYYMI